MTEDNQIIESLTPEQEARAAEYREMYLNYGWSTEPANREVAEAAVAKLYELNGYKVPEFIWFDSPHAARDTIIESGESFSGLSSVDGNFDAYWVCLYKYVETLREGIYDPENLEQLNVWDNLVKSMGPCWPFENYCLMTERPIRAERDDEDNPHSEDGPAIAYRDGNKIYMWHGITLPDPLGEVIIEHPWDLTMDQIRNPNIDEDVRQIMQSRWCYEEVDSAGEHVGSNGGRWLQETGAKHIHEDVYKAYEDDESGEYITLMRVLLEDSNGDKWLMCSDSSTDRVYYIAVDSSATTCEEAHKSINGGIADSDILYSS